MVRDGGVPPPPLHHHHLHLLTNTCYHEFLHRPFVTHSHLMCPTQPHISCPVLISESSPFWITAITSYFSSVCSMVGLVSSNFTIRCVDHHCSEKRVIKMSTYLVIYLFMQHIHVASSCPYQYLTQHLTIGLCCFFPFLTIPSFLSLFCSFHLPFTKKPPSSP